MEILYDGTARPGLDKVTLLDGSGPYLTYGISLFNVRGVCLIGVCAVPSRDLSRQTRYVLQSSGCVHSGMLTAEPNPVHYFHWRFLLLRDAALARPEYQRRRRDPHYHRQQLSLCSWRQCEQRTVRIPEDRADCSGEGERPPAHGDIAS